jgi:small subunit ribosomal protein S4
MSRYTGPKAKRWRRIGQVPADGSATAVQRRTYPPGQHGLRRRAKLSEYAQQLHEKQKARYTYGLQERQFANYYREADASRGVTGVVLMQILELRLDNVVFRLGLAKTRGQARQIVSHGHVRVNGKKVTIPSYRVSEKDAIALSDSYTKTVAKSRGDEEESEFEVTVPDWLSADQKKLTGTVLAVPDREQIDASINEQLIVEYYSR